MTTTQISPFAIACFALFIAQPIFTLAGEQNDGLKMDDWPAFRGPNGDGISPAKNVPTKWGPKQNIKWKAALPQPGNGSPIVVGDRVFITSAEDPQGIERSLYCFRRLDGKQLWVQTVKADGKRPTHKTNPYCATTPVSDGKHVVVWHGSAGLYCYDMDGKQLWGRKLDKMRHQWGYASSPIIHKGRIILNHGPGQPSFLTALELTTGKTVWRTDEKLAGNGVRRPDGSVIGTWATPIITEVNGKEQIICTMPTRLAGYDPENGNVLWSCDGLSGVRGDLVYSSPHICEDVCVAIGGYRGPGIGVKLGGTGDVTKSHQAWRLKSNPQSIGSGVFLGKHLYIPSAGPSVITCLDPKTGREMWKASPGGNHWGSLVFADGHLYVTDQQGNTHVFRPNPQKFDHVASNRLGDRSNSTPALCNGQIIIRTFGHLYCIGE